MTSRDWRNTLLALLALAGTAAPASGQVKATWFDINPSQSNDGQNGASGGRINHVGAASDLSTVYAATEWGGLYQSFDQGNTWVRINTFSPSATWDVKVDPSNSKKVYATSSFDGRANPQSGISVSTDAGTTWTPVNIARQNTLTCGVNGTLKPNRISEPAAWQIAINPSNPQTVFVGTSCGLARSLDGGATWAFIDPSPADLAEQVYSVLAQGRQTVDVISDNGHFRSTDNGASWTPIPVAPGLVFGNSGPGSTIAGSPAESYVLLAANANNIFESDDGGATWPTSLNLPLLSGGGTNVQGRIPFVKTNQLATSSQFDVWFGDINVFKTTAITPSTAAPGGSPRTPLNSWSNLTGNAHSDSGDVGFDPRATAGACPMWFTSDGGLFKNTDPNNPSCQNPNWSAPTITPHATWLWGFDGVRLGPGTHALTYGLQDDGNYAATTVMEGHNPPPPNWNNFECCDVLHNSEGAGRIISLEGQYPAGTRLFRLFTANQDGSNDSEIPNYPSVQRFTRSESGKQNAPTGGNGYVVNLCSNSSCIGGDVYFTTDITAGTIGWTSLGSPTAVTTGTGSVKVATVAGSPNVYYDTSNGNPETQGLIFRSALAAPRAPGSNWTALPLPPGIAAFLAYDVDPTNGNRVIAAGVNAAAGTFEIWMTTDFGTTWNRLTNLENLMVGSGTTAFLNSVIQEGRNTGTVNFGTYWQPSLFKFDPLNSTTIIAGAVDAGVFLSMDDGNNWNLISTPTSPTSQTPHIPRPLFAYFSPGRFDATTSAFDVWVGTRGAGVMKVVIETQPSP